MIDYFFGDATSFYDNEDSWVATSLDDPYAAEIWEKLDLYMREHQMELLLKSQKKIRSIAMERLLIPKIQAQPYFQYFNKKPME